MFNSLMPEDYTFNAAVIESYNHVCEISLLYLTSLQLQQLATALQEKFSVPIRLMLGIDGAYSGPAQFLLDGSWADLPQVRKLVRQCCYTPLHFPRFRKLFCPRLTLSTSTFEIFFVLGRFRRRRSSRWVGRHKIFTIIGFRSPPSRPDRESRRPPRSHSV